METMNDSPLPIYKHQYDHNNWAEKILVPFAEPYRVVDSKDQSLDTIVNIVQRQDLRENSGDNVDLRYPMKKGLSPSWKNSNRDISRSTKKLPVQTEIDRHRMRYHQEVASKPE